MKELVSFGCLSAVFRDRNIKSFAKLRYLIFLIFISFHFTFFLFHFLSKQLTVQRLSAMSLQPELVQWLSTVLRQHYSHAELAYHGVAAALVQYTSLRPRTRVHTDDQGASALLLCIYGSLPAMIQQHRYNIPVEIWLPLQFPLAPPMAYVVPTSKMLLNPGNYVDANGRCYLPYLAHWNQQTSSLPQLLAELSHVFALEPPVYAKPPPSASHASSPQPALPPKQGPPPPTHVQSPPPIPPIPQTIRRQISPEMLPQAIAKNKPTATTTEQPNFIDSQLLSSSDSSSQQDINRQQVLRHISVILNSLQHNAIEPQLAQFRQNTSQIQQSISQFDKIFEFEANQLDTINSDMSNNKQILESTIAKAHDTISTIHSTPQPQPDDTIIAESIPQGQLYELVSQDMAINDTLTALNSAFSQGKIPLVSLLKHSRQLSRDQFEKRTLIRKISAQLGLSL